MTIPWSTPGLDRASLSLTGCIPFGPAAVGEPGTGGFPVFTEAYSGFAFGTVETSETVSKRECSLFTRPVSHPLRAKTPKANTPALRSAVARLILLRN
jgi:hypothetical protein